MQLSTPIKTYLVALGTTLVLDLLWIGLLARSSYTAWLGDLARTSDSGALDPLMGPALLVYAIIPLGVVVFAIPRVLEEDGLVVGAAKWGGGFGAVLYGVFELTNYSILKDWSLAMTVVDLVWGIFLCFAVAAVGTMFANQNMDRGRPLAEYAPM